MTRTRPLSVVLARPLRRRSRPARREDRPRPDRVHASVRGRAHCHRCAEATPPLRAPSGPGPLVALYNATDAENWDASPIGEWWGVITSGDGSVTGLLGEESESGERMEANGLAGVCQAAWKTSWS